MLLFFAMWPQYICASEPASDSLPPELVELQSLGRLTVRALWAWNLVPEPTAQMVLEFRSLGHDLLAANREQIMEWLKLADDGQMQLTTTQRDILTALIDQMNSGSDVVHSETVHSETVPVEPAPVETLSANVVQTDVAVTESEPLADVSASSFDEPAEIKTVNIPGATNDSKSNTVAVPVVAEAAETRAGTVTATAGDGESSVIDDGVAIYRDGVERTGVSLSPGPANTPVVLWKLKTGEDVCTPPVVSGGSAYFGCNGGYVYAVDVSNGEIQWKFLAEGSIDNTPAVSDGVVYFGNVMGDSYTGDMHLFAVDARTGKERWRFKSKYYGVDSSPAVLDGLIYFGANDNHLYALNALTGEEKWNFPVKESAETPAISAGLVFFSSNYQFYAVDLDTGEQKWRFMAAATIKASPVASGGNVYFGSEDSNLYALDCVSGQEKWKYSAGLITYPPAVHNGTVFLGSFDNLFALDVNTGLEKWKINTNHLDIKAPVIYGDTLYIGAENFLMALDIHTGQEKWRFRADGEITSPVISKGVAYFWSWDGYLYAVR